MWSLLYCTGCLVLLEIQSVLWRMDSAVEDIIRTVEVITTNNYTDDILLEVLLKVEEIV